MTKLKRSASKHYTWECVEFEITAAPRFWMKLVGQFHASAYFFSRGNILCRSGLDVTVKERKEGEGRNAFARTSNGDQMTASHQKGKSVPLQARGAQRVPES